LDLEISGKNGLRFHKENVEPLSSKSPRVDVKISQFVDRVELLYMNVVIKSFNNKVLVKGQMNNGIINIKIPSNIAQLSGDVFINKF
jgi:hypothetical protein